MAKLDVFLDMMFHTADQTHVWHLQTKSDPVHRTLNGYYDGIRCQMDRFAEACMGYKGIRLSAIGGTKLVPFKDVAQVQEHLEKICKYCNDMYGEISREKGAEHLLAIIDDIRELIAKTKYLLTLS